jgi:hypothetical protein
LPPDPLCSPSKIMGTTATDYRKKTGSFVAKSRVVMPNGPRQDSEGAAPIRVAKRNNLSDNILVSPDVMWE